jgi:hypothetical protein
MACPARIESIIRTRKWLEMSGNSLAQKSSGEDRTPFELFIGGVMGSEEELRRLLDTSADGK